MITFQFTLPDFNIRPLGADWRIIPSFTTYNFTYNCRLAENTVAIELLCVKTLIVGERRPRLRWFLLKVTSGYFIIIFYKIKMTRA